MPAQARSRAVSALWVLLRKDLYIEFRTKEALSSLLVLIILIILTFTFALDPAAGRSFAPAILWVTFIFSGLLAVQRAFVIERENGCWHGLLLCPVEPATIYLAKMAGNFLFLAVAQLVLLALLWLFFRLPPARSPATFLAVNFLGIAGFASLSTLFSGISVRMRAREMLLPLLVLPLLVPVVVCAVAATRTLLDPASAEGVANWVRVLIAIDAIYIVAGWAIFDQITQE